MKKSFWLVGVLLSVVLLLSSVAAYGAENNKDAATLAPYFFIEGADASTDWFPLKDTQVTANVNGVIADIYVRQTYANEGSHAINASYVFPASANVTVHGMKMEIGDEVVTARIKEREEAKQEFEQAKNDGQSASLLEEQRPNVFTMNVANIMPGDVVSIELHYTEMIISTEGVYEFVFPTVVGPRYSNQNAAEAPDTDQWVASPYLHEGDVPHGTYGITVNLTTGVPITNLTCRSHDVTVTQNSDTAARVTLSNPADFAGDRDFILDYKLTGPEVNCGLLLNTGETENFFMLMVQPPERFTPEEILPREYIFVLDVSGSMHGYPLDTAKELIRKLVGSLKETDTFNLILFSGASQKMSPLSVAATEMNIKKAINLIDQEDGGGGTELAPALTTAVNIPLIKEVSRSVVVITDGYIDSEKAIFDIISEHISDTSFFSFGIGSSVNRYLIDGIAKAGMGESFVVTEPSEASKTADLFRTYIQSPVLTDIKINFEGFDAYDVEPASLPTLFAKRPIVVYGKWRGNPSGTVRITGKAGDRDYAQDINVSETKTPEANSAIRYLWARKKVERLLDYGIAQDSEEAVKKEVTAIGLDYSMMTPYTSFIAVVEKIRNTSGDSTDVNQPLPLPKHVSDLAVGYTVGSEPGIWMLLPFILAVLLIRGGVYRKKKKA